MNYQVKYELATHNSKPVIFLHFEYSPELNKRVKELIGVRWSQSKKAWNVLDSPLYRQKFGLEPKPMGQAVMQNIRPVNQPAFRTLMEMLQLKAYSQSTIKTYRNEFAQLLYVLKDKMWMNWMLQNYGAIFCTVLIPGNFLKIHCIAG